tara:strand:- start:1603 stop:1920 length:318 start_codon:yes stop_codon:yes gene_type:complete
MLLKLEDRVKLEIIDEALTHIKKVEADPDVVLENVDNYDAWFAFNDRIDFNVSEADFGMNDEEANEWHCSAYAVELNEDETFRINTDIANFLFTYKEGEVTFHNE